MIKNYAIVDNRVVVNVIVADEDFIAQFHPDSAHPYEEVHEDDTLVARIGDTYDETTGSFITPSSVPAVPQTLTRRQFFDQLIIAGLDDKIMPILNAIPDDLTRKLAISAYQNSTEFDRNDAMVVQFGAQVPLTSEQLDQLFLDGNLL